jgi:hypothetical protein
MSAENPQLSFMPDEEPKQQLHPSAEYFGVNAHVVDKAELPQMAPRLPEAVLADVELAPEAHALRALDYFAVENRAAGRQVVERGRVQRRAGQREETAAHEAKLAFAQAAEIPAETQLVPSPGNRTKKIPSVVALDPTRQQELDRRYAQFRDMYAGRDEQNIARRDRVRREGTEAVVIPPK